MVDIILDIDSIGDDILALMYAALNEKMNLLGVTTVNGACGSVDEGTNVALNIVELLDKDIPVYAGAASKYDLSKWKNVKATPVNMVDDLRKKFGDRIDKYLEKAKTPTRKAESKDAKTFMIETFNKRPGEVVLVATGPLTNVALALKEDPSIAKKIKHAYILGGCFGHPGNMTPVTEFNIWADPEAAKVVFNSGMEITLVPLDVCENNKFAAGMLTRDHLSDIRSKRNDKLTDYLMDKFPIHIDVFRYYFNLSGFPMDDIITVALAADEDLCTYSEKVYVDVEVEGRLSRGQTVAFFGKQSLEYEGSENKNVRIAQSVDAKRFMNMFVDTLSNN
jgi:purine nucleosidase